MESRKTVVLLQHVRQLATSQYTELAPDGELLDRFVKQGDAVAFGTLVERHGPMVQRLCRRILGDSHAAEDAFQATFMVLTRKAKSIKKHELVVSWLYRVAFRIAARARADTAKSRNRTRSALPKPRAGTDPALEACKRELCVALDEELYGLPVRLRAPMLLCYVKGLTADQSARELGWSLRTLQRRLEQGREFLRRRLTRRGITLSAALLSAALSDQTAFAGVLLPTLSCTFQHSTGCLDITLAVGTASSARATILAEKVVRSMAMNKLKLVGALVVATGVLCSSAGLMAYTSWADPPRMGTSLFAKHQPLPRENEKNDPEEPKLARPAVVYGVVHDEVGKPMAAARVWLRHGLNPPFRFRSAMTDDAGRFQFDLAEHGLVTLVAVANGYSFAGQMVQVQEGQPAQKVTLRLHSPQELRIRLVGEGGKPVHGAHFGHIAFQLGNADWFWFPLDVLTAEGKALPVSDKDGLITIPGIPKGAKCRGQVKHPKFAYSSFDGTEPGKDVAILRLQYGHALTIRTIDGATKKPVPGATVFLAGSPNRIRIVDTVDHKGELVVRLTEARDVEIQVSHAEMMAPGRLIVPRWSDVAGNTFEIEMYRKAKVTGRCLDASTGKPLPGIEVGLISREARTISMFGYTDALGRYEIEAPEGPITVEALSGAERFPPKKVKADADATRTVQAPDLKLKLLPTIRGRVVDRDGNPVTRAIVMYARPIRESSILTDANGRFEFRMHEHDSGATIVALHPNEPVSGGESISIEDLQAGKGLQIQLQPESEIQGTIVDKDAVPQTGVRVWLRCETKGANSATYSFESSAFTDGKGTYRFQGLLRNPRQYQVCLTNSWEDRAAPRSAWISPTEKKIVVEPLVAPERLLKGKAAAPALASAPELSCRHWLNSPPLKLESLRGKVVLLVFLATWSRQPGEELPEYQLAHELYADKGLVVIGIHHNSVALKDVDAFAKRNKITFPIGVDNADGDTCERFRITHYPSKILIDRNGKLMAGQFGSGNFLATLRKAILDSAEKD